MTSARDKLQLLAGRVPARCFWLDLPSPMAAELTRARPEIDDIVRSANRFLVVLDDDHGVAQVAQPGQRRQQFAAAQSQRLTEVLAAAKPLYAALSAEQKAIADDLLTPRRGHGGRGHRSHG